MTRSDTAGWRLSATLNRAVFEALDAALEDNADAVVVETIATNHPIRDTPSDDMRATMFGAAPLADDPRPIRLRALLQDAGVASGVVTVEPIRDIDWCAASLASFELLKIGRFTIHGSHEPTPFGRFALSVDAGLGFGSGRHETTQGCLLAFERIARRRRVRRVFDIGTGSGILAVAAARLWPARIIAVDHDPMSVAAARATARRNALAHRVTVVRGNGFRVTPPARLGRADLICANIRAAPLAEMAPDLARHLGRGGTVILSGLLATEEATVLSAYRAARLRLRQRVSLGAWVTLILTF